MLQLLMQHEHLIDYDDVDGGVDYKDDDNDDNSQHWPLLLINTA